MIKMLLLGIIIGIIKVTLFKLFEMIFEKVFGNNKTMVITAILLITFAILFVVALIN